MYRGKVTKYVIVKELIFVDFVFEISFLHLLSVKTGTGLIPRVHMWIRVDSNDMYIYAGWQA